MARLQSSFLMGIAVGLGGLALVLGGCSKAPKAPDQAGVCWHAVPMSDGTFKFNLLGQVQRRATPSDTLLCLVCA